MPYLLLLLALLSACAPRPLVVEAPQPLPRKEAPPGAEPYGYWEGETMTVLLADTITDPCMRAQVFAAASYVGDIAGVHVIPGDYIVTGKTEVGLAAGEVLVMPFEGLPLGVVGRTSPELQSGGWVAAAWVAYAPEATCSEQWFRIFVHEFGHVYGLQDTRDDDDSVMHWLSTDSATFRPWELEHLRRRISNR